MTGSIGYSTRAITLNQAGRWGSFTPTCIRLVHPVIQSQLADLLCDVSGMDNVFSATPGAEANEVAIKLARLYGHQR